MISLFHETAFAASELITKTYSTSFTLGIKALDKRFHESIYGIYGLVRYADEIVDSFHGFDKEQLLADFKADTYKGIEAGISLNPVIHAYQMVANKYKIENELTEAFFQSMAMDLDRSKHNAFTYEEYIYGSAEVVGLMCLRVFCEGDDARYQKLKEGARKLGAAFQKVNFLRDIKDDYLNLGRVYFPGVDFVNFRQTAKEQIEADIENDFDEAYKSIVALPEGAKKGVYLAYRYYRTLFNKIKKTTPEAIKKERVRVPDYTKMVILFKTWVRNSAGLIRV